jgi:hypothetical protein
MTRSRLAPYGDGVLAIAIILPVILVVIPPAVTGQVRNALDGRPR